MVFVLAVAVGFFAGRVSVRIDALPDEPPRAVGQLSTFLPTVTVSTAADNAVTGTYTGEVRILGADNEVAVQRDGTFRLPFSGAQAGSNAAAVDRSYPFVASRNSTLYHATNSAAAARIKAENRVYFTNKDEAERQGFRPGSSVR